jgi:hypothetical protein
MSNMKARNRSNSLTINASDRTCRAKSLPACRQHVAAKSHLLRNRLAQTLAPELKGRAPDRLVRQAVTEAEALAWSTPYPLLFLPVLFEEKLTSARQWADRQQEVLERQKTWSTAF